MSDLRFVFSQLNFGSVIDILLVALVFYWILTLIQGTQAVNLLRGILVLSVLAVIAASILNNLTAFSWLIDKALPALLVAIPVIFQPELRRALERVGRSSKILTGSRPSTQVEETIQAIGVTVVNLSQLQHGALIIFERETGLEDHIETGIRLDAVISPELLATIFFPGTALHDGAVIIRNDKIVAAATVLPLGGSLAPNARQLGTRHRAALGISESTDAIAVVVSEETGLISVAHGGQIIRGLDQKRLEQLLQVFFKSRIEETFPKGFGASHTLLKRLGFVKSNEPAVQTQSQSKQ